MSDSTLERGDLATIREAARTCRNCPLWKNATQTVFGEGKVRAAMVLVGEQPGDQEDRRGRPFVGPAGKLLDRALEEAGLARREIHLTNAVKHFKWEPQGRRRLHRKPSPREIAACRLWLEKELQAVRPDTVLCLGATAAVAVLGPRIRVTRDRGREFTCPLAGKVYVTVHPSLLLRLAGRSDAEEQYRLFLRDLRAAGIGAGLIDG